MRYFNTLFGARSFKLKTLMLALFCSDRGNYTLDYSYSFHCFAPSFHLMNIYNMRQGCHWIFLQVFLAQFMSVSGHKFAEIAAHISYETSYTTDTIDWIVQKGSFPIARGGKIDSQLQLVFCSCSVGYIRSFEHWILDILIFDGGNRVRSFVYNPVMIAG